MRRYVLAGAAILFAAAAASAQPFVTPTSYVVPAGGSTTLNITGTAGQQFAVIGSTVNAGFSYAGVALAVGTDVAILGTGVLDGSGLGSFVVTPSFPPLDRYYVQVVTSNNGFASIFASSSIVLLNGSEARNYMPIGGIVQANGTISFATQGVTVTKAGSVYTINHAGYFSIPSAIPSITPTTAGVTVTSLSTNSNQTVVTFSADSSFVFTIQPVRR